MKTSTNMAKTVTVITILLLTASATLMTMPANAQLTDQPSGSQSLPAGVTPDVTIDTIAYLSFTPNPIGYGQSLLINVWLTPATRTYRYFSDFKLTITKPDGTTDVKTMDSYRGDATAWLEYAVDQVGEWTIKFEFPGGYFPAGNYYALPGSYGGEGPFPHTKSVYYRPSSTEEQTLIVQDEIVYSWPTSPLPTDYWTRPVSLENREWWPILGNYPGTGYPGGELPIWDEFYPGTNNCWSSQYGFHPWVQGPTTAHVVWKRQGSIAGLIGGPAGQYAILDDPGTPSLVYAGRAYQSLTKVVDGVSTTMMQCYDLRTGEVYWEQPAATAISYMFGMAFTSALVPNIVAYSERGDPQMVQAESFWSPTVELLAISGGYLYKWDPWTGAITGNYSIAPLTGGTYYMNEHVLSVQDLGSELPADERYRLINWTTRGPASGFGGSLYGPGATGFESRVVSNTSYARSSLPSYIDWGAGIGVNLASTTDTEATGVTNATILTAYSLTTGALLWTETIAGVAPYISTYVADHGKFAFCTQTGYFIAYDLYTGNRAWTSEEMDYPWGLPSFGAYAIASAYGMFFRFSYDGIYAYNWTDGTVVWKYVSPALAAFESPYIESVDGEAVYPFNTGATIADGKMYTYNTEHTQSYPTTRGWSLHCINITTGEGIWRITGQMSPGAIADGYLTAGNQWDGYMYVFGRGQSATTVTAPDVAVPLGSSVVIKGTVLDQSLAQPSTPCVSEESMTLQMEYLHMQRSIAGLWGNETIIGVPVSLDALDPNGNYIHIADVVTDGYSGTFGYTWTPEIEGQYAVTATFNGDESYGSSFAQTYVSVGEATEPYPTPIEPEAVPDNTVTIIAAAVAVIIAVAIATILILRK